MKKNLIILYGSLLLGVIVPVGCNKGEAPTVNEEEISFSAAMPEMELETKAATPVTALPSMKVSATKGAAGKETEKWTNVTFTSNGETPAVYRGNKWWSNEDEEYHFFASNSIITFAAAGSTVAATNTTDVVCAYLPNPTYRIKNTLTFDHIFARIGDVKVTAAANYKITDMSITLTPKTGGTYNIRTGSGKTDGTGWSDTANGSVTTVASATEIAAGATSTTSNDLWLVPGTYVLTANWTAKRDDYSHSYSGVASGSVSIVGGKVNTITATLNGYATELTFDVTVNPWGTNSTSADFPYTHD